MVKLLIYNEREKKDSIPSSLPLLDYVGKKCFLKKGTFFSKYKILAAQHLLGSAVSFFNMLEKGGAKIATYMGLALIYEDKNESEKAISCFKKAAKEIEFMGISNIMDKLHVFSAVMRSKLNKSNAYKKVFIKKYNVN